MDGSTLNVHPHHLVPAILLYVLPLALLPDWPIYIPRQPAPVTHSLYSHTPVPGTVLGHVTLKDDTTLPQ
jgi:hypothetical protein